MCSILEFWHYRIVQIGPRVVQGPFRGSKKQFASEGIWPSGKIGHHMGRKHALVQVWGYFFKSGAVVQAKRMFLASGDDTYDTYDKRAGPCSGGSWAVGPKKTTSTAEYLSS